ncbi:hypothetical protein [Paenibacillus fonticola]|uniref:hypothetical protein n=1 Tax=Paenibacillus fonticola TaxID=379896 RepID=UPI000368F72B|nr:hypothetical protein [Paenibacillus fonticola]
MAKDSGSKEYTEMFLQFSSRAEAVLIRMTITCLIGLCLFQAALRIPVLREYIASADKFEGVAIEQPLGR